MSTLLEQASLVMIPSGYKEDVVYSQIPTSGAGDLSFTRASNGTRVNSAGLVEVTPWNLVEQSETFDNASWSKFSASITANYDVAPNGTNTADRWVSSGGAFPQISQSINLTSGAVYTASLYVKSDSTTQIQQSIFIGGALVNFTPTTTWQRITVNFTASASDSFVIVTFSGSASASSFLIWGAMVNLGSTAKPYFPTTDRLNVPRLTYQNGGGGCPSLLLEKQSTNLVKYSQDISNTSGSYWGDGSSGGTAVATANYATSPDGTQNATRLQLNEGSLYSVWQQVNFTTPSTSYTYSIWMKAVSGTPTIVFLYDGTGNRNITLTNEWVRYTWTFTAGSTTIFRFGLWSSVWGTSSTADILAWGAQCEVSSYPTSYIPTTSSSATRVADACFKTGISSLIGQSQGVLFVDLVITGTTGNNRFSISDGSNTNWIFIGTPEDGGTRASRFYIKTNGSVAVDVGTSSYFTIGQRYKLALAYKSGDWAVYANGSLLYSGTDSIGSVSSALSQFNFFNASGGTADTGEQINQAILFPTRLSNSELASLTTI